MVRFASARDGSSSAVRFAGGSSPLLSNHFGWVDVGPEAFPHWRAQAAVLGPIREFHFADQLGPHPGDVLLRQVLVRLQRAFVDSQRGELFVNRLHGLAIEPRAHVPGPLEFALIVDSQNQSTEVIALALGESAQEERIRRMNLVFHPITRTSRFIETRSLLPYDPFHALLFRRFEQSLPIAEVLGIADHVVRLQDFLQQALALDERQPAQIAPVQIQQIEGIEDHRMVPGAARHRAGVGHIDAALQQLETGHAALVQGRDFAIHDRGLRLDVMRQDRQLGILPVDQIAVARNHPDLAVLDIAECADAVPFHLVDPLGIGRRDAGCRSAPASARRCQAASSAVFFRCIALQPPSDLLLRPPGQNADRVIFRVPSGLRGGIFLLEEEPLVPLAALHAHDGELARDLFAVQEELEVAARKLFFRRGVAQKLVGAPIPQHDAARAVVPLGNDALEASVLDGMVLDHHGQPFFRRIERRALGNRPGFERAPYFQAQIVVQMAGVMALDTILSRGAGSRPLR